MLLWQFDRKISHLHPYAIALRTIRTIDRKKEYDKQYYLQNKDKKNALNFRYRFRNKLKILDDETLGTNGHQVENGISISHSNGLFRTWNKDKKMEYDRCYYRENEIKLRELNRRYRTYNQDKKLDYEKQYFLQNKSKWKEFYKVYREKNKDKLFASQRLYRFRNHKNPDNYSWRYISPQSWKTPEIVRQYFETIGNQLHIANHMDWYRISMAQIQTFRGLSLYPKFGNLGAALQYAYPDIDWDMDLFSVRGKKAGQRWLNVLIRELLPGTDVLEDFQHPELSWGNLDRSIELDLWIPKYSIGIEFQGVQHYCSLDSAFGPSGASLYWERDIQKINLCNLRGITLILIPYWWDGDRDSLAATLFQARPDVFPKSLGISISEKSLGMSSRLSFLC